jgi:predicted adenine nucleotide alpha hydrolase (AANH) superfamily ATPase/ribonuclease HII
MHSLSQSKLRKPAELRIHCDEAGRWPLAWPVTVGCSLAIGKPDLTPYKDSKQLTAKQRERLYTLCKDAGLLRPNPSTDALHASHQSHQNPSLLTATGRASSSEIDEQWIIKSIHLACLRGIGELLKTYYQNKLRDELLNSDFWEDILSVRLFDTLFSLPIDENTVLHRQEIPNSYAFLAGLIRDGNHTFWLDQTLNLPVVTIIKGDQKNALISAASIVAKVERDLYMTQISEQYPEYFLHKHKGYGSKLHRESIATHGLSPLHRSTYCKNIVPHTPVIASEAKQSIIDRHASLRYARENGQWFFSSSSPLPSTSFDFPSNSLQKPSLLLHICCAPDLSRPLHWLKQHFKLYLFRYNPNIHPRKEHEQRYSQFLKLVWLEPGDYEILEDRYDPKEFFQAMIDQKTSIDPDLADATDKEVLKQAWEMPERSDRCNPCYSSRLLTAAKMAAQHNIPYFTSTLLISPKKIAEKLFLRGKDAQEQYSTTKFLRFDFAKNGWYNKANELTRTHGLRRQNYCGCGRTIPKPGEKRSEYKGG